MGAVASPRQHVTSAARAAASHHAQSAERRAAPCTSTPPCLSEILRVQHRAGPQAAIVSSKPAQPVFFSTFQDNAAEMSQLPTFAFPAQRTFLHTYFRQHLRQLRHLGLCRHSQHLLCVFSLGSAWIMMRSAWIMNLSAWICIEAVSGSRPRSCS